jgi:DNA end-binding protein Ku
VLSVAALGVESAQVRQAELKLARQLIEQQSTDSFDPTAYPDEIKARLEEAIQRKVQGEQIRVAEPRPAPGGNVVDLMSALKASLERDSTASGQRRARASTRGAPKRAAESRAGRAGARAHRKAAHS